MTFFGFVVCGAKVAHVERDGVAFEVLVAEVGVVVVDEVLIEGSYW